jgi:anti-sigma regulatory factor (Ser/Thr protein kinase)
MDQRQQITLACDAASPGLARRFVRQALERWSLGEVTETAELLASELVTNAVVHAGTPAVLTVRLRAPYLLVEVADGSDRAPVPVAEPGAENGRGLQLVEQVAASWGHEALREGKVVWFALSVPERARPVSPTSPRQRQRSPQLALR